MRSPCYLKSAILFTFFFLTILTTGKADRCKDFMLLGGADNIINYGMDTTQHWWVVTEPFTGTYRLIIDSVESEVYQSIEKLTFSPDGNRWAFFGLNNVQWQLVTNDTVIALPGNQPGEIKFSPNSNVLAYSFFEGEEETIRINNRTIKVLYRVGSLYLSYGGERFAFLGLRGSDTVININGKESPTYDEIMPIGFWYDGKMIYAARNGNNWELYKNDETISEAYSEIFEARINLRGNALAILARQLNGKEVSIMFSEEYYDPIISKQYEWVGNLSLHPTLPMIAYRAMLNGQYYVVLNNTEYFSVEAVGNPMFTYDGSELYFIGCQFDCFCNINGKKYPILSQIEPTLPYAMKPKSNTIAYSTSTSLIIRELEGDKLYAGMMVDEIIQPRYNWRTGRYETLGRINRRLYMMTCSY